jgi:Heliorhodopsin
MRSLRTTRYLQVQPQPASASHSVKLSAYNWAAVCVHLANAVILFALSGTILSDKPENVVFVSGKLDLTYANYAVVRSPADNGTCRDVLDSPGYAKVRRGEAVVLGDIMPHSLYDFTNKTVVRYDRPGSSLHTHYAMAAFFALSCAFQALNGVWLGFEGSFPRVLHYLEYSVSSSIMVVVLAANVGILEVVTLVALFGLFFGMNLLGACAEVLSWAAAEYDLPQLRLWWVLPHAAGWVLYLLAYAPIIVQYERGRECSVAVPAYLTAAIYLELLFFTLFGAAQTWLLVWRTLQPKADVAYWTDFTSITLSVVAKTFLAWVLIGPVLSAKNEKV